MSDYYQQRDISAASTFTAAGRFDFEFLSAEQTVNNLSADPVEVSFDGTNVHAVLTPYTRSSTITWTEHKRSKLWVRCPLASGAVPVEVFATSL